MEGKINKYFFSSWKEKVKEKKKVKWREKLTSIFFSSWREKVKEKKKKFKWRDKLTGSIFFSSWREKVKE